MTGVKSIRFLYTGYIKTLQRVYFAPATTLKSEETVKKTVEIVQHIPHKQSELHNFCRLLVKCDITKGRMLKKGLVNFRQSYYHTERKKTNEPEKRRARRALNTSAFLAFFMFFSLFFMR